MWNVLKNPARTLGLSAPRSPYRDNQAAAVKSMASLRPAYQGIRQQGEGIVNTFLPQQIQAGQQLADFYKAGPDEAGMNAGNTLALRGMDNGFAAAGARLKSLGARSGADVTGAQAGLKASRVAQGTNAQLQMAQRRAAEVERFKRGALGVTGQMTGVGSSRQMQGLQGHQGLDSMLFGSYGNMAAMDEAQKAATLQRILQFAQGAGQLAGGF